MPDPRDEPIDTPRPTAPQPGDRILPRGVNLLRTIEAHQGWVLSVAFDSTGDMLASGSNDGRVKLWKLASGELVRTLEENQIWVYGVAFAPVGNTLASGSYSGAIKLWDWDTGQLARTLQRHERLVTCVAFDPSGVMLASGSQDGSVKLWDPFSGKLVVTLAGHLGSTNSVAFDWDGTRLATGGEDGMIKVWESHRGELAVSMKTGKQAVYSVSFDCDGRTIASAGDDGTVKLWDAENGVLVRTLEGHTGPVHVVAFSPDGELLASKSGDGTVRLWRCDSWEPVAVIRSHRPSSRWVPGLAFHPTLPLLATVGSDRQANDEEHDTHIYLWDLDLDVLLGKVSQSETPAQAVHHTTAKIVLVGDHGVGKTGLGSRLALGHFHPQFSSHGQQFWVLDQLSTRRQDGTDCEAILWDLAGQPDYRLIHALFLDDVDLALVLFDSSNINNPLHGVEFWLKQLKGGRGVRQSDSTDRKNVSLSILVGAQADRGTSSLLPADLEAFCQLQGISGYVSTSARDGRGLEELIQRMKDLIPWENKPATVTTITFKRIKDYVLKLKESQEGHALIVSPAELRQKLEQRDAEWEFSDAEMMTALGHLENYGYVRVLRTSKGEERILVAPELLNNLAASFVLEARRNLKGLGALEEKRLMAGDYTFPELDNLSPAERDILLDSAALLFIEHNICFRETDFAGKSYLVFPELINLKKPVLDDDGVMNDGVSYTVSGAVENVYASLVVLLGYTQTFTRTNQWQNQARYVMGDNSVCGFRQGSNDEGELELVLYFGANVPRPGRKVFEGLFESFLARRNVTVFRYEPVICRNGHTINRAVVRERFLSNKNFAFCAECGEEVVLQQADEPIQFTQIEQRRVEEQRMFAARRSRFEEAVFQLASYAEREKLAQPDCFISYAWGDKEEERWVERNLATDLQKAGIKVLLDRWEISRVGASVSRFIQRIARVEKIIVVGTQRYLWKFENKDPVVGYVVAAEVDLILSRMLGTEAEKETVLPLLLSGEEKLSLPPLLHGRVYADFRNDKDYFTTAFDLILDLYGISHGNSAVADLRQSLSERDENG